MEEQILRILRDKDDFMNKVEIKENAKGEPSISVTTRGDDEAEVVARALKAYKDTEKGLK